MMYAVDSSESSFDLGGCSTELFGLPSWLSLEAVKVTTDDIFTGASDTPGSMRPKSTTHIKSDSGSCWL